MLNRDTTAQMLSRKVGKCDLCGQALPARHTYAKFASTIADKERIPQVEEFFLKLEKHDWKALHTYNEFDGSKNAVVAYVIACPQGGGMVVGIRSPAEFYESDEVHAQEMVPPAEITTISKLLSSGEWRPL